MDPSRRPLFVLAASLLLLLAAGSQSDLLCQSVVANGKFDADLSSWSGVSGIGFAHWDSLDADGSSHSGSVLISNDSGPGGLDTSIDQCVHITGGIPYEFGADIHPDNLFLTPQSASGMRQPLHTGQGYVLFNFYASPSCGGPPSSDFVFLGAENRNEWQSVTRSFVPAHSVVSALITVDVIKGTPGGNLSAHFDNILMVPPAAPTATPIRTATEIPTAVPTAIPTAVPTTTPTPTATPTPPATPTPSPADHRLPRVVPFR